TSKRARQRSRPLKSRSKEANRRTDRNNSTSRAIPRPLTPALSRRARETKNRLLQVDRPVGVVEESLPALVLGVAELNRQHRAALGTDRGPDKLHAGFVGSATPFLDVAFYATANDVLPARFAPPAARDDVVQAQLAGREPAAAILAAIGV